MPSAFALRMRTEPPDDDADALYETGTAGADVYVPKDIGMAIAQQFSFACSKKVMEPENMQAACSCHRPLPAKLPLAGAAEKV